MLGTSQRCCPHDSTTLFQSRSPTGMDTEVSSIPTVSSLSCDTARLLLLAALLLGHLRVRHFSCILCSTWHAT